MDEENAADDDDVQNYCVNWYYDVCCLKFHWHFFCRFVGPFFFRFIIFFASFNCNLVCVLGARTDF